MSTIGEFASIGRVSMRMLRYYDRIGLLTPARVDPDTGYRLLRGRAAHAAEPHRAAARLRPGAGGHGTDRVR